MKSKKIIILALGAMLTLGAVSMTACNTTPSSGDTGGNTGGVTGGSTGGNTSGNTDTDDSVIKSLEAVNATGEIKLDDTVAATNFYKLTGKSTLTTKQKKVTITSSDPSIVLVSGSTLVGKALGKATITVTSSADTTKSCSFEITVTDVYFDRSISSSFGAADDFEHELDETNPHIETGSNETKDIFIKAAATTEAYVETKMVWKATADSENFPKMGIVFSTLSNPVVEDSMTDNRIIFGFNPESCHDGASFDKVVVCEVQNSGNWAWNAGVDNTMARHKDDAYLLPTPIGINGEMKIAVARKGLDFHCWINDVYAFSCTSLHDLFSTSASTSGDALTNFGFFEFNSDVVYSDYSYEVDAAKVDEKINSITDKKILGVTEGYEWAAD